MPPGRLARQRPRSPAEIRGHLHAEVLGQLCAGVAQRRGVRLLGGPARALRLPARGAGDVALPLRAALPALPLRRHHGDAAGALAWHGDEVQNYEACDWRREDTPLLEFLRKSNKEGAIAQWVKRLHGATGGGTALEEFANACPMKGQKLVACDTLSIYNDRWFGQWLALRKPFRSLEDLLDANIVDKARPRRCFARRAAQVPVQYQYFANAIFQCPDYWADEDAIRAELELEATGNDKIETFLAMVRAQRALVERFVAGELDKADDAGIQAP